MKNRLLIAIDGLVASGKGTIARLLAQRYGLPFLDTGGLYRGLACKAMQLKIDIDAAEGNSAIIRQLCNIAASLTMADVSGPNIYTEAIGLGASKVAKIQEVRDTFFKFQRDFAMQEGGAILDGRDIGTYICPDATHKFFLSASLDERAKRRFEQEQDPSTTLEYYVKQVADRDERDKARKINPLKPAADAVVIDTTDKSIQEVFDIVVRAIEGVN